MRKIADMMKTRVIDSAYLFEGYPEAESYIKILILRALLDGGLFRYIAHTKPYAFEDIGILFGIEDFDEYKPQEKKEIFEELYEKYKNEKIEPPFVLQKNIERIANLLRLERVEKDLLMMFAIFNENEVLETLGRSTELNFNHALRILAAMVDHPYKDVKKALQPDSRLMQSKVIEFSPHRTQGFIDFFNFEIDVARLFMEHRHITDLFKEKFLRVPTTPLQREDYDYIHDIVSMMQSLLQSRIKAKKGANILLYGKAGYGKTELIKLLAKELGSKLYEITYMRSDGEAIDGHRRLEALNLSTMILDKRALILFDEFDDIDDRDFFSPRFRYKAWLNRFLEKRSHIVFWVANSIDFLDEAMIRRFDLVLQMPEIPKQKRITIAKKYLKGMDEEFIKTLASQKEISPGVFRMLGESIEDSGFHDRKTIVKLLNEKLKAQGFDPIVLSKKEEVLEYSLEYINADYDVAQLAKFLKKVQKGCLCFFGMPGTGKSEYAKFLAKELDKEILFKRASDLLSMWVGGTEANIKAAFEEAKAEDAILLIDEADSFLADRTMAQRGWEVTQVNEMLTQIENFDGIFIATTNFIDYLDRASLRRFDLKVEFKPLRSDQKVALFKKLCKEFELESVYAKEVARLEPLTLGDFVAVKRGARLLPFMNAGDVYRRLIEEIELKKEEVKVGLV